MAHIFISYSRKDERFARILTDQLQEAGFATWRDPDLLAGDCWQDAVDEAIRQSTALVVIMSAASLESRYVNYEWAFAVGAGVRVIPVLLGLRVEDLHQRLGRQHALDFTDPKSRPWTGLFQSLANGPPAKTGKPPRIAAMPPVIEQAEADLNSVDLEIRIRAFATLQHIEHPAAVEVLARALESLLPEVRIRAAMLLAERKDPRGIPELLYAVRLRWVPTTTGLCRFDIAPSLVAGAGRAAVPHLIAALQDESMECRHFCAVALGAFQDADVTSALRQTLMDRSVDDSSRRNPWEITAASVRRAAARSLVEAAGPQAIPWIVAALDDPDSDVRREIVDLLGEIRAAEAVPAIAERLQTDTDEEVRCSAAKCLAKIGDGPATAALIEGLRGMEESRQEKVLGGLHGIDKTCAKAVMDAFKRDTSGGEQ